MSAAYYAQFHLNEGKPVAGSIPATEHSVMTAWPTEIAAIRQMIDKFGGDGCIFATVMDSYDYTHALESILPLVHSEKTKKGNSYWVLRPDSGDPVKVIIQALEAAEKVAGTTKNSKGFKVINGMGAIQGDGIGYSDIENILNEVLKNGYSAENVAFGMGGGLLQKINRDTMSFATKLMYIKYQDGKERNVMKKPKTDGGKCSLPGLIKVLLNSEGVPTIYPKKEGEVDPNNLLKVYWDKGPVPGLKWETFSETRKRVASVWTKLPNLHDTVSEEMKNVIKAWTKDFDENYTERTKT